MRLSQAIHCPAAGMVLQPARMPGGWWLSPGPMRAKAKELIERYRVKTTSPDSPIEDLSGGNVQRAILAREGLDRREATQEAKRLYCARTV